MKSYINVLADFHDAPIEKEVTIPYPTEELEKKMKAAARGAKKTISPETIEAGDVAVIAMESDLPKFNKKATFVTVSGGLLDPAFEETLLGRRTGDVYETELNGHIIKVTIKQVTRSIFPEPTDEMVREYASTHDEYDGISTVEAFRERIVNDYFEEAHSTIWNEKVDEIVDYLLTHSDFEFDDSEINSINEESMNFITEELKEQGKTLDSLSEQECLALFGVPGADDVREMVQINSEREIATMLIIADMHGADARALSFEELAGTYYSLPGIEKYLKETLTIKEER